MKKQENQNRASEICEAILNDLTYTIGVTERGEREWERRNI